MGFGFELPLKPLFFNFDVTAGSLVTFASFGKTGDDDRDGSSSLDLQARFTVGCKIFEHLGIFAGVSYAWTYLGENSPVLSPSLVKLLPEELDSRNRQRIGFFAGLQF
jgi:hypothetical protein